MSVLLNADNAHAYGCRTAILSAKKRRDALAAKGKDFDPEKDNRYYIGFYRLTGAGIATLRSEVYDLRIDNVEEEGEASHCNIVLFCKPDLPVELSDFKSKARRSRLAIIDGLYELLTGPVTHICPHDGSVADLIQALQKQLEPRSSVIRAF